MRTMYWAIGLPFVRARFSGPHHSDTHVTPGSTPAAAFSPRHRGNSLRLGARRPWGRVVLPREAGGRSADPGAQLAGQHAAELELGEVRAGPVGGVALELPEQPFADLGG